MNFVYQFAKVIGELFARHLDLDYAVSDTRDRFKRHRALLLRRPTLDLSGSYTCKVSTFTDEEIRRKSMTIYGEEKEREGNRVITRDRYPKPPPCFSQTIPLRWRCHSLLRRACRCFFNYSVPFEIGFYYRCTDIPVSLGVPT